MDKAGTPVETSGKTADEAIDAALRALGATRDEVTITVLDQGSKGILGFGARQATVRVERLDTPGRRGGGGGRSRRDRSERTDRPDRPARDRGDRSDRGGSGRGGRGRRSVERETSADRLPPRLTEDAFKPREGAAEPQPRPSRGRAATPSEGARGGEGRRRDRGDRQRREETRVEPNIDSDEVELACRTIDDLLRICEIDAEIMIREPETPAEGLGSALAVIDLEGDNMGLIIGRGGETLMALQYLVNLIVSRRYPGGAAPVFIDVAQYRKRRELELTDLAQRMGDRVRRSGSAITLEPMSPAERRVVHLTLADEPDIYTESTGAGEDRKVVILPGDG